MAVPLVLAVVVKVRSHNSEISFNMQLTIQKKHRKAPYLLKERWIQTTFDDGKVMLLLVLFSLVTCFQSFSQNTFSEILKKHNAESIPYITVQELAMPKTKAIVLDAREKREYQVSHLKNAIHVGYDFFDLEEISKQLSDKQQTIVVYCSLGIRSEDIAEQFKNAGYTNVYNLYGGIFEWKNNNFVVYDADELPTDNVHTYSKAWSSWLLKGTKIYD